MNLLCWVASFLLSDAVDASLFGKDVPPEFRLPESEALDHVNPMIGNGGHSPNGSGGMIPSTGPPFAMTRWVAQTRQNYVSVTPYNQTDTTIHGFQGTHQPAIWMGESGQVVIMPGLGNTVRTAFETRGMLFDRSSEISSPSYYQVQLRDEAGNRILAEQSSTSRVGHLRFSFASTDKSTSPYIVAQATRAYALRSDNPSDTATPVGSVHIDPDRREISGVNPERQDDIIGPGSAKSFAGYFVARFDTPFQFWGTALNDTQHHNETMRDGEILSAYVTFLPSTKKIDVRVGVSFISIDQARANLDAEVPDYQTLATTASLTRTLWSEKLDRVKISSKDLERKEIFYTALFHSLQYPCEHSENGRYYSGFDDSIHTGESYTGYSIWDIYRAEWSWLILFAPERIGPMITSMLQDYREGGWLPMWKNIAETNIMIGTHADGLIAEAVAKNISGFDANLAYAAVRKDATVPPTGDTHIVYSDREEHVGYEVRAGLSTVYEKNGWVADDIHSESASRTLAYAYDDYAVSVLARHLHQKRDEDMFQHRSQNYRKIYNSFTGFMEARNASGSWAGPDNGWTEGDKWAYTFDVVHDIQGLIGLKGGNQSFIAFLDAHFDGGHNDHTNEPSHHIPYLYALAGAPSKTQWHVWQIAAANYNNTASGLSGNEDCGQMSAWYLFSSLGFYPVNPISASYVVGRPFFDKVTITFPGQARPLIIDADGASEKTYVESLHIGPASISQPLISHSQLLAGGTIKFKLSLQSQKWGSTFKKTMSSHSEL